MNKTFLFSVVSLLLFDGANATICKLIPNKCYTTMGTGYLYDTTEPASWDITSNCWGKKYICPDAFTAAFAATHNTNEPIALGRKEIANAIKTDDFDATILNGDCFGARIVKDGGAQMKVDGNYVRVWCSGVLDDVDIDVDETFDNGDITHGTQPSCTQLADAGYVNIQNGKCYGKSYNRNEYRIQCDNGNPTLIVLNGADPDDGSNPSIKTKVQANTFLNTMYTNAKKLHAEYFKD